MNPINISIDGLPAAKGNWIAVHGVFIPPNREKLNIWTRQIQQTAREAYSPADPSNAAIDLKIKFFMPVSRNKGACITRPDLDKLARAVMDALAGIVYVDDSQVVRLTAEKVYNPFTGADIEISEII